MQNTFKQTQPHIYSLIFTLKQSIQPVKCNTLVRSCVTYETRIVRMPLEMYKNFTVQGSIGRPTVPISRIVPLIFLIQSTTDIPTL